MVAVAEAITGLLIFGAVVAKFVSHRQDELMSEIHRVTFEERLDRIETNLHMVDFGTAVDHRDVRNQRAAESNHHPAGKRRDPFFSASCARPAIFCISRG